MKLVRKQLLIALGIIILVLLHCKYTETTKGVYYPNAYEEDCFTDMCLEMKILPLNAEIGD